MTFPSRLLPAARFPHRAAGSRRAPAGALATVLALSGLLGLAVASPAAADDTTWAVQPGGVGGPDGRSFFEYQVAAGSTVSDLVSITNLSPGPVLFNVYAADGINDYEQGGFSVVSGPQDNIDLGRWLTVAADAAVACPEVPEPGQMTCLIEDGVVHIELPGNSRAEVPFTIAVPSNASPGDHTAGIMAQVQRVTAGADGQTVIVEQRVGSRVHLRVDGELAPSVQVSGLVASFDSGWNPFTGTASVDYAVTNNGNLRLDTAQVVRLTGPFGIELARVELDPVEDLLPGQSVRVPVELPSVAALFVNTATVELVPTSSTGEAVETVSASAIAWAIPWLLLAAAAVLAAAIWLLIRWRRHRAVRLAATFDQIERKARDEALATQSIDPRPASGAPRADAIREEITS
ncbi:hypothetical protein GCM10027416_16830 [Okibacterium endophyticum]